MERIEKILNAWGEEELRTAPSDHSARTPECMSFPIAEDYANGNKEVIAQYKTHYQGCRYCQMVIGKFEREKTSQA